MISFGLLIFIVVAAAIMPYIGKYFSANGLSFVRIFGRCVLFVTPFIYLTFFFQGLWESYKGNPVFPAWGASLVEYLPDIGAVIVGLAVGSFVAFVAWMSMKANH